MVDKIQMNLLLTAEIRDTVRQASHARGVSQGELVEQALLAFLAPASETASVENIAQRLTAIEEAVQALAGLLTEVFAPPPPPKEPAPRLPIATYEQMYGPIVPAPPPQPVAARPRRSVWRRWFLREGHP